MLSSSPLPHNSLHAHHFHAAAGLTQHTCADTFMSRRPLRRSTVQYVKRSSTMGGTGDRICCRATETPAATCEASAPPAISSRRLIILRAACVLATAAAPAVAATPDAAKFTTSPSGLKLEDLREGSGAVPVAGDRVSIHWSGFTIGYQGKRIDNTSARDEPFDFTLGRNQVIPAIEEAVAGMRAGGIRRVEIPGTRPELGWSRSRNTRYSVGPRPKDFDGQRALDFVLDNDTLQDFNRTLLIDIKLLSALH